MGARRLTYVANIYNSWLYILHEYENNCLWSQIFTALVAYNWLNALGC